MASKPWTTKPPLGTQINWSHPLTQGLVHAVLFNEGGGPPHDLVTGDISTQTGTGQSWGNFQGGLGRSYDGSGGRDKFQSRTANQITGPITVMCGFVSDVATSDTNWHDLINKRVSLASGINIEFGLNYNNNVSGVPYRQWFWANGSYQVISSTAAAVPQNTFQIWTGTRSSPTAGSLYVNGVNVATGSGLASAVASTTAINYGAIDDGTEWFLGKYSFGYVSNRELSPAEIQQLSQNPYLFIQAPKRRFFGLSAGTLFTKSFTETYSLAEVFTKQPQKTFTDGYLPSDTYKVYSQNLPFTSDSSTTFKGAVWGAFTFTPATTHAISYLQLFLGKSWTGDPGTVTVGLYATSAGKPTGAALATGTLVGNNLTFATAVKTLVTLGTPYTVTGGVLYSIVISAASAVAPDGVDVYSRLDATGTILQSSNSGSTWGTVAGYATPFAEFGDIAHFLKTPGKLFSDTFSISEAFTQLKTLLRNFTETFSLSELFQWGRELQSLSLRSDANLVWYSQLESTATQVGTALTNNGSVAFNAAKFNNGADLGTSNTTKSLTIASNLGVGSGATSFSLWVKINTAPSNQTYSLFVLRTTGGTTNYIDWQLNYIDSAGTKSLFFNRSKPGVADQGPTYTVDLGVGALHHIVFTYDGTNIRGYLDGTDVTGAFAASGVGTGGADNFNIGKFTTVNYASATIDDFPILTRGLTAAEVKTIYFGTTSNAFTKTLTEVFTLVESFLKSPAKVFSETLTLAESFVKQAAKTFTETFSLSEVFTTLKTQFKTFTESLTLTEIFTKLIQKPLSETYTLVESFVRSTAKTFIETFSLSEVFTAMGVRLRNFTDALTLSDNLIRTVQKTFTETYTIVESFLRSTAKTFADTFTIVESFAKATGGQFTKTFTETYTLAESFVKQLGRTFTETITVAEVFSKLTTYARTLTDSVTLSEAFLKVKGLGRSFTENISLTDIPVIRLIGKRFTEVFSVLDGIRKYLNGVLVFYTNKYSNRGSSYGNKNSTRNTTYSDKNSTKGTNYHDKYNQL